MREKKGWSQENLAEEAEMGQARISLLENPNYQNLSLNTLKRIANVFDVALVVRFEPFSRLFTIIDNETPRTLAVPSFVEEFGSEINPITTSAEKVAVLADYVRELQKAEAPGTRVLESQQESGIDTSAVRINPLALRPLMDPIDKYKQKALGENQKLAIGGNNA
jgi:transcriptional regulator with XRE-family HTH domain